MRGPAAAMWPLVEALERDGPPVAVKHAVALVRPGFPVSFRLPVVEAPPDSRASLQAVLHDLLG